jgi:GT2 family glycosyltransferase
MKFLRTTAEWAIFVDDDIVLPCGSADVFNQEFQAGIPNPYAGYLFIDRMMSNNLPLVGALYFGRHPAGKAQYSGGFESAIENRAAHQLVNPGIKPCSWVATGAMKIHRSVFERIMAVAPEHFPDIIPTQEGKAWSFFQRMGKGIGEDVSFCWRAAKAGIQPHVDTSLICLHEGICYYGPANTSS